MMRADSCGAIIGRNDAEGTPVKIYEVDERSPALTAALTDEGVTFTESGCVDLRRHLWDC